MKSWLLAVLLVAPALAADGIWIDLPRYPHPISNNAITSVRQPDGTWHLYSFMGIVDPTDTTSITPRAYRLAWPGGTWQPLPDVPNFRQRARIAPSAITVGGQVYLLGGYIVRDNGSEATDFRLFRFEPQTSSYTRLADVPTEVDDTIAVAYADRYIILISGWHGPDESNTQAVQIYDTQTDTWQDSTPIPNPPGGLFGHAGAISGTRLLYMDGARVAGSFVIHRSVYVGDLDPQDLSIAWQQVARHPGAATYRAASGLRPGADGHMLFVGGTGNPYNINGTGYNGQPSTPLPLVLDYDPKADAWVRLDVAGDRPLTMDHRGLAPVGPGWAVVGGMTGPGVATDAVSLLVRQQDRPPGDADIDERVDLSDLALVLKHFGQSREGDGYDPRADLSGDDVINMDDLRAVLEHFGRR